MACVAMRGLNKKYDAVHAVVDVNLDTRDRGSVVRVSPSGLREDDDAANGGWSGNITWGRSRSTRKVVNDLPPIGRDIAMVFQNYTQYPHMTVYDNMVCDLKMRKFDMPEIARRVEKQPISAAFLDC